MSATNKNKKNNYKASGIIEIICSFIWLFVAVLNFNESKFLFILDLFVSISFLITGIFYFKRNIENKKIEKE